MNDSKETGSSRSEYPDPQIMALPLCPILLVTQACSAYTSICRPCSLRINTEAEAASNWCSQPVVRVSEHIWTHRDYGNTHKTHTSSIQMCPSTDRTKWTQIPSRTKKLFTVETCWERASELSPVESPQVCQAYYRQDPCPSIVGNTKQTQYFLSPFLSSFVNFLLPFIWHFSFSFWYFACFDFHFHGFLINSGGFRFDFVLQEKDHKGECGEMRDA